MANFFDLDPTQTKSSDGKYIDLVFTELVPDTDYGFTFAWVYEDASLGISGESNVFDFKTIQEPDLLPPNFTSNDLYAINSIVYISWDGNANNGLPYGDGKLKQVNVWIQGGDFGENYIQYATPFTAPGQIQINSTTKSTYCVKLQAETFSGQKSEFSNEFCVTLLKQPKAVYNVRHEWDKVGNLTVFWKFDPTFKDATNDNTLADAFALQLVDDVNDKDGTWWTAVEKNKIPPLEQKIVISADQLKGIFGQVTAFQINYNGFIYVRDKNLQTSLVTGYQVTMYTDPLTPPVISAIKGPLSYTVSYTNNSEFDRIYIEDSTDNGATWVDRGSSSSNPVYVSAGNSLPRQVRARFSKIRGGLTGYSNIVNVTPDPLVSLNDEAPNPPTSFSGTGGLDSSGSIGFNGFINFSWTPHLSSSNIRGYRIRYRPYKASAPFEEWSYVDSPGSATTYRLTGLAVGTTYEIAVGSFNEFNKESVTYTSGANVTVSGTPFIGTNVTTSGYFGANSGSDVGEFRFGYAVEPGKRGIRFNDDNYWYIDSNASAAFKLGGDSENYIQWNGQAFIVQGDIRAKKGNFSGHVEIKSGGSLFSGVMNQNQSDIDGAGYILNSTGLKFNSSTVSDITTISGATGRFVTKSAEIGGWNVGESTISSSGITLTSGSNVGSTSIIATNAGGYVGIKPKGTSGSDIVLWAGTTSTPSSNNATNGQAGFQVNADGQLYATGAIISGKLTVEAGSSLGGLLNDTSKVYYSSSTPAVPSGGHKQGDAWVDTANNNQLKIWSGTAWVIAQDSEAAKSVANTKTKTTFGSTEPSSPISGDVWFDTSTGINYFKVYDGTAWVRMKDSDITAAQSAAQSALSTANTKAQTTFGASAPVNPNSGDIWFDTNFDYFKRYNGTTWERMKDADITAAQNAAVAAAANASTALSKAAKFGVDGSLVSNLIIENSGAAIYSSYVSGGSTIAKNSYASTNAGFYMGWDSQAGVLYPAFNIGNANAYVKWSNYNTTLEIKGNIVNGGDHWNGDGSFRLGGPTGITKGTTGQITIGSNVLIQGDLIAKSLDTTSLDIATDGTITTQSNKFGVSSGGILSASGAILTNGSLTITSGTRTTTVGSDAIISLVDTSTGWNSGGALTIQSNNGANYSNFSSLGIAFQKGSVGVNVAFVDNNFMISTGSGSKIRIQPNGGLISATHSIDLEGRVNISGGLGAVYVAEATGTDSFTKAVRNITVATSAPSGGIQGDIWIQI